MVTDSELAFGELRGLLEAFARLNDKTNYGYTFTFDLLPKQGDLDTALATWLKQWLGREPTSVAMTLMEDWQSQVRTVFQRWLFQYQLVEMDHLVDPNSSFTLTHYQGGLLDHVMATLGRAVQPLAVWKVEFKTKGFYECEWDDVAIEVADWVYLLHLGVSD